MFLEWNQPDPPVGTITTPANMATYTAGQVVHASFSCSEGVFGPGLSACQDSNNISATITSGEQATGSITGRPLNTGSLGQFTYSVTAASTDGFTGTTTNTYTVIPAPPTAMISSPLGCSGCLRYYAQNSSVPTTFSCTEGLDGPGIAGCRDANFATAAPGSTGYGALNTSSIGQQRYYVTATSKDGESGIAQITYAVADPPTATVSSPTGTDPQFFENTPATISFSCADGAGGPGIESCGGSGGSGTTGTVTAPLDTSSPGSLTYRITALSKDQLVGSPTWAYTVLTPLTINDATINLNTVSSIVVASGASSAQTALLPAGPGSLSVTPPQGNGQAIVVVCCFPTAVDWKKFTIIDGNSVANAILSQQHSVIWGLEPAVLFRINLGACPPGGCSAPDEARSRSPLSTLAAAGRAASKNTIAILNAMHVTEARLLAAAKLHKKAPEQLEASMVAALDGELALELTTRNDSFRGLATALRSLEGSKLAKIEEALDTTIPTKGFTTALHKLTRSGAIALIRALRFHDQLAAATATALIDAINHRSVAAYLRAARSTPYSIHLLLAVISIVA